MARSCRVMSASSRPDRPAGLAEPLAELGLLAGRGGRVEAADRLRTPRPGSASRPRTHDRRRRSACPIRCRPGGCRSIARGTARDAGRRPRRPSGLAPARSRARSSQPSATSQSPSRNWTKSTSGSISLSRSKPAFRARAAENGRTCRARRPRRPSTGPASTLPSVEPEST